MVLIFKYLGTPLAPSNENERWDISDGICCKLHLGPPDLEFSQLYFLLSILTEKDFLALAEV